MDAMRSSSFDGDDGSSAEDFTNVEEEESVEDVTVDFIGDGLLSPANGLVRRQLSIRKRKKRHFTGFKSRRLLKVERKRPSVRRRPGFRRPEV